MITKSSRHTLSIPNNTNNEFNIEKVKRRFYSSFCDIKIKKCGHVCCHSQEKCDNCGLAYKLLNDTLICPKMVDDFIKVFLLDTSRLEPEFNYRKRSQFIDDFGKYGLFG
ncbi:MAG: hypothetical protein EOM67_11755 [Spirochaetia bacterium]|nr:hypothetical protein [Spirochaetia bacterium]